MCQYHNKEFTRGGKKEALVYVGIESIKYIGFI